MLDFKNLQKYRENNRIEAKKSIGGLPVSLWETYSAFANTLGGLILLGVIEHQDKSLSAVDLQNPQELIDEFWSIINDKNRVSANILTSENVYIQEVDGCNIIVIDVPKARREERPVYLNNNAYLGTYRRNGEGDYRCSKLEVDSMFRDASIQSQDSKVITELSLDVFNLNTINKYLQFLKSSSANQIAVKSLTPPQLLLNSSAVKMGEDKMPHPTIAGLLMFGKYNDIIKYLPNYSLEFNADFLKIKGKQKLNLFDFYCFALDTLKNNFNIENGDNNSILTALIEGLANSLVNADYFIEGGVKITWGRERIVFSNAGSFRLEVNQIKQGGVSDPRNNLLIKMFHNISISNLSGSGIPKIFKIWKQNNFSTPKIIEEFDPDRIIFVLEFIEKKDSFDSENSFTKETNKGLKNLRYKEIIIDYLTDSVSANIDDITCFLGVKKDYAEILVNQLVSDGILIAEKVDNKIIYKLKLKFDK